MPASSNLATLAELLEFAAGQRHNNGIAAVPANLFRDLVIEAATAGAKRAELTQSEESFLRDSCDAVDGLRKDFDRLLYVQANRLYRLGTFVSVAEPQPGYAAEFGVPVPDDLPEVAEPDEPPEIPEPEAEPAPKPKPKRGRKPKPKAD